MKEKVKKILKIMDEDSVSKHGLHGYMIKEYAQQICQRFPKTEDNPDGFEPTPEMHPVFMSKRYGKHGREEPILKSGAPKPDRLLTDEELESAELAIGQLDPLYEKSIVANDEYIKAKRRAIAKVQDVETDSIVRAEYQERVEEIFPKGYYPAHLMAWADQIEREYGYHQANIVVFLRDLASRW